MKILNLALSVTLVSIALTTGVLAEVQSVPEPGSLALLALGVAGLVAARRGNNKK